MTLQPIKAYFIVGSIDDRRSGRLKGPFKDQSIAAIKTEGAGWYGSDGAIEEVSLHIDEEGNLYEIGNPFRFVDVEEAYQKNLLKEIKSKLSPEELKFLKIE